MQINKRIISISHAHFQTMTKTHVQFKKDQYKTVGGVKDTRHMLLSEGAELLTMHHEPSKAEYHVLFSLKRRGWGGDGGRGQKMTFNKDS